MVNLSLRHLLRQPPSLRSLPPNAAVSSFQVQDLSSVPIHPQKFYTISSSCWVHSKSPHCLPHSLQFSSIATPYPTTFSVRRGGRNWIEGDSKIWAPKEGPITTTARSLSKLPEMHYSQEQLPEGAVELPDAASFSTVADEKGLISICGFGSLLSEKSARYTFPNLQNFRVAVLPGFRRVFAHVAPVFLERGIANVATKEMSSLSVEPCSAESILVTVFEISIQEVPAFIEREHEFRFLGVALFSLSGEILLKKAVVCARYSDEEYRKYRCQDNEEYQRRYGRFGIEKIWRDDLLPCRVYLRHCVLAAKNLSKEAHDSFLDHTYLGDRSTTIRQHLAKDQQIMAEEPPPLLRERYGG
jgi:hypothetical protein